MPKKSKLQFLSPSFKNENKIPLFESKVIAGFPSPADDFLENSLDLNSHVIKHPAATFFVKVEGRSMEDANIFEGDILVVDRSLNFRNKDIVIAIINGDFTVKRIKIKESKIFLEAASSYFSPIELNPEWDCEVWGVVTYIIHKAR